MNFRLKTTTHITVKSLMKSCGGVKMDIIKYKSEYEKVFEKEIKPHNFYSKISNNQKKYSYPLDEALFYYRSPPLNSESSRKGLKVSVQQNKVKTLYLSYLTLNNKFAEIPDKSFVDTKSITAFYLDLGIETSSDVEVIPYIVHYNNSGKNGMTRITMRNQLIRLKKDDIKLRLTFKVRGSGNFAINNISRVNVGVK